MARNVKIKARVLDFDAVYESARMVSGGLPELIQQEDVFFHTDQGRLKLRLLTPSRGELIYYERDDTAGPKTSSYQIAETDKPDALRSVLEKAIGEKQMVRKQRWLFRVGRTRIHLDRVEGLGDFMELEVVLDVAEPAQAGETEARELMSQLGIDPEMLVQGAYADLLAAKSAR